MKIFSHVDEYENVLCSMQDSIIINQLGMVYEIFIEKFLYLIANQIVIQDKIESRESNDYPGATEKILLI